MTAPVIYFLEGEAKADLLASWGLVATCLDTGAESKWKPAYTPYFTGRHVVVVPDNDQAGEVYLAAVAKGLFEAVASVRVLRLPDLPEKGDVLDWIETPGNDKARFLELAASAVPWEPSAPSAEVVQARRKRSRDRDPSASPDESPGGRGAERLIPLLDDFPLYLDDSGAGFIFHNGRLYQLDVKSRELAEELFFLYWTITDKALAKDAANAAITYYSAKARRDGIPLELFTRIGERDGHFFYDLMNNRAVELSPGSWRIIPPPVMFRHFSHQQPQPDPLPGGDPWRILDFVRVATSNELFTLVTVITCFIPQISHPIVVFNGPQGSGKSTMQAFLNQLVDPSTPALINLPRKNEDIPVILRQNHSTAWDNVSVITGETSDTFCVAVTGGGFIKRELHTDTNTVVIRTPGFMSYSCISSVSDRPDLHERSVKITVERIQPQQRRTDKAIWRDFNAALPSILGGIFDVLAKAMVIHPDIEDRLHELPRMADFATWGYAIAEALGGRGSEFLQDYTGNASMATADLLEHNTFFSAIVQAMERPGKDLSGTFAEVLFELRKVVDPEGEKNNFKSLEKDYSFPKAPQGFRGKLERLKIPLEDLGISYVIAENRTNKGRVLCTFFKRSDGPPLDHAAPVLDDLVFDETEVAF
jgi:energy-coupling factor transporter ATP-binding protein EcfA2